MNVLRLTVAALLIAGSAVYAQEPPPPPPEGAPAFEPGPGGPDRPMPPPGPEGREGRREFRGEPGMPPMDRPLPQEWMGKDVRELVETVMMARLSRELGLNDEQTVLTMRRFSEFREQSETAKRERGDMMKALKEAIDTSQPDGDIEAKLVALVEQDRRMAASRQEIFERVSEGLSVSQRARLYVIMGEFESDMRKLIQKARMRAGGQRGRFPGGPPPEGEPWGQPGFRPDPDRPMPPGPDGRRFREPGPPPQGEPGGQPGFRPDPDRPMPPGPMGREGRREFRGPEGRRPMDGPPPPGQEPGPPPPGNP